MRFLVDAQLPPALARWLSERGHEAAHVLDLGLLEASDRSIWTQAGEIGATLITKDQDFITLLSIAPNGVSVVWVRVGNTTRRELLAWFDTVFPSIEQALMSGESLVEVRP
jgi:predicted nuclease of predicted toxin-antitoxin system